RPRAAAARLGRATPLLAGGPQPGGERPLADPVAPRDLGLAALAGLVGRERPLAQVGGVGTRHRSPPVGVKVTSTADRGAGSAVSPAIRSSTTAAVRTFCSAGGAGHDRRERSRGMGAWPGRAGAAARAAVQAGG